MDKQINLSKLRSEINEIDEKLLGLLKKRFEISCEAGKYKLANRLAIEDKKREEGIIKFRINSSGLNKNFIMGLFEVIFKESKRIQMGLK